MLEQYRRQLRGMAWDFAPFLTPQDSEQNAGNMLLSYALSRPCDVRQHTFQPTSAQHTAQWALTFSIRLMDRQPAGVCCSCQNCFLLIHPAVVRRMVSLLLV